MNSEVYRDILYSQLQSINKNWSVCTTVQMDNEPKHILKATQKFFVNSKKSDILQQSQPNTACSSVIEEIETEGTETHKWVVTEGSCSQGPAEHLTERNSACGDDHVFSISGSHLMQRISIQVIKTIPISQIMLVCKLLLSFWK